MGQNLINGSYYFTSRAGEQLATQGGQSKKLTGANLESVMSDYVSTVAQDSHVNTNENQAIRYNALASFNLGKSSAVNKLNSYVKKVELFEKLTA